MANERERDIGVTRYSYWSTLADGWIFFPTFYRRKLAVLKLNPFSIIIINVAYYAIETLCVKLRYYQERYENARGVFVLT